VASDLDKLDQPKVPLASRSGLDKLDQPLIFVGLTGFEPATP
jgi:hypothetical protein